MLNFRQKHRYWSFAKVYPWNFANFLPRETFSPQKFLPLKYNIPKKIPVIFHNGPNYDYDFIIKELAKAFEEEFNSLGENKKKYIIFSVPIKKDIERIGKRKRS